MVDVANVSNEYLRRVENCQRHIADLQAKAQARGCTKKLEYDIKQAKKGLDRILRNGGVL